MKYTIENDVYDDGNLSIDLTRIKSIEFLNDDMFRVYLERNLYYNLDTCKREDFVKHWRKAKGGLDSEKLFS